MKVAGLQSRLRGHPEREYREIETPMGHFGMFCLRPEDQEAIGAVIAETLNA